jgi:spore maturation protein CgeB
VEFFDKLDDIIYDSEVEIDLNYDNLSHIIEDGAKRNRFTEKYTALYEKGDLPAITSTLIAAIENSRKIAKRNYKYVVPQYRSANRGNRGKYSF